MAITKVTSSVLSSGSATDGYVLTADGSGNSAWEAAAGGGPTFKTFGTDSIMIGDTTTGTIDAANYNTGLGVDVFAALTSGDLNTAVGYTALQDNTSGTQNTAIGSRVLPDNTTGDANVGVGEATLFVNTTGNRNVALGLGVLQNSNSDDNIGIGYRAQHQVTSAAQNVAIGSDALFTTISGSNNVGIGYYALRYNTTGNSNTAMGRGAMFYNTTGNQNTAIGQEALANNTTAANNTAVGYGALVANTTGYTNTCIGTLAGDNITTGYGHTMVGYAVDPAYASGSSGELGFGREMITNGSGYFTVGVGTNKGYYNYGSTNGFTAGSDERLKEEIENSTVGLSFINDLTLRTFKWKKKKNIDPALEAYVPEGEEGAEERHLNKEETQLGMIAQEVKAVIDNHPEIPAGFAGHMVDVKGTECLDYVPFIQPLLKAVQELSAKNDALEARIAALES